MWRTRLWAFFRGLLGGAKQTTEWDTASEPGYLGDLRASAKEVVATNFGHMATLMGDLLWSNGWHQDALRVDAHPERFGGPIVPRAVVIHTTDMVNGFHPLLRAWTREKGKGNAAHFLVGRTAKEGVVQFCDITHNANHAGGTTHGWFRDGEARRYHPNLTTIGIEVDNAGRLVNKGNLDRPHLYHPESGVEIPVSEAYYHVPTHTWWHAWTEYQREQVKLLVDSCLQAIKQFAADVYVQPNGTYADNGVRWAQLERPTVVGHATLDPSRKTDPGPAITDWIRENY